MKAMNRNASKYAMRSRLVHVNALAERGWYARVGAVVLPALEDVPTEPGRHAVLRAQSRGRRFLGVREDCEGPDSLAARLGGAGRGGFVEHAPDDSRVLLTVAAFAKLAAEIGGADRRDGLDSMVGGGGGDYVAARGADTQRTDPLSVHRVVHAEERHAGFDVLDPVGGVLKPARLTLALALKGGVKRERDEALACQALGVQARGLLLDAAGWMRDDDRGARAVGLVIGGVQVSGEPQASIGKSDVRSHGRTSNCKGRDCQAVRAWKSIGPHPPR
jgi:hypothetical protein